MIGAVAFDKIRAGIIFSIYSTILMSHSFVLRGCKSSASEILKTSDVREGLFIVGRPDKTTPSVFQQKSLTRAFLQIIQLLRSGALRKDSEEAFI